MKRIYKYSEVIMSFMCMFIFVVSTCQMIPFVSVNSGDVIKYTILVFVMVKLSFVTNGIGGRIVRWSVPVFVILCTLIYLFKMENAGEIAEELNLIWQNYIQEWNSYYEGTEIVDAVHMEKVEDTLCFVVVIVSMFLTWFSCMTKSNIIMSIAPFSVIVIEHLVGISPDNMSVILLFAGVVLCRTAGFSKPQIPCVVVGVLCIAVKLIGAPSDEKIHDYSETMKGIRNDVVEAVTGIDYEAAVFGEDVETEIGDEGFLRMVSTDGSISNDTPLDMGLPVMKVTLDKKPNRNVYFKGFHGSEFYDTYSHYHDDGYGFSNETVSDIKMHLTMNNLDVESIYEKIVSYATDNLKDNSEFLQEINCNVEYYIGQDDSIFVPYFASDLPEMETESDVIYRRNNSVEEAGGEWIKSLDNIKILDLDPDIEEWISKVKTGVREEWEDVYGEYSFRYNYGYMMEFADDEANEIYEIVEEMNTELFKEAKFWDISPYPDYFEISKEVIDIYQQMHNERRIKLANIVRKWLADNTTYTLTPDILDIETNPVSYFLLEGKKGYCVHYASAAIALLRELDVPSRYASGFVATVDTFEKKGDKYVSTVFDSHAHAWVEIFLEGIGWIPFEMTSGYDESERTVKQSEETVESTLAPSPSAAPVEQDNIKEIMTDDAGLTDSMKIVALILIAIAVIVMFFVAVSMQTGQKKLADAIKKRRAIYAIKMLNRKIYRKLRIKCKLNGRHIGDDEYEEALKKTYSAISEQEWERFMEIVKATAFSNRFITEEEMEFCYEIYKKCC